MLGSYIGRRRVPVGRMHAMQSIASGVYASDYVFVTNLRSRLLVLGCCCHVARIGDSQAALPPHGVHRSKAAHCKL